LYFLLDVFVLFGKDSRLKSRGDKLGHNGYSHPQIIAPRAWRIKYAMTPPINAVKRPGTAIAIAATTSRSRKAAIREALSKWSNFRVRNAGFTFPVAHP